MPTSGGTSRAVAKILNESAVISLNPRCGGRVAVIHCAVDHIEAAQPLVQPQLEVGIAASREVLRAPLDVEDAEPLAKEVLLRNGFTAEDSENAKITLRTGGGKGGEDEIEISATCCNPKEITIQRSLDYFTK